MSYACSHPECDYVAQYEITNHHCQSEHGMTRKEVVKKYGQPKMIRFKHVPKEVSKWINEQSPLIVESHFSAAEAAARRLHVKTRKTVIR